MPRNTCELHVGRLIEIRLGRGYETAEDVDEMIAMVGRCAQRLPAGTRHVTVADWRACRVLSEAACERATEMFLTTNPRTERAALLCTDRSPTAVWQFVRLLTTGGNDQRRLFLNPAELEAWVEEVLTPAEKLRLHEFLSAPDPRQKK